jgi:hypothetical protein
MPDTSLSINPQTTFILYFMWSQTQNRLYKYALFIVYYFSKIVFETGARTISQTILVTKSNMQMCRMCRVV